jgi:hypothetical protein
LNWDAGLKAVTLGLILFVIGLLIIGYGFSRPFDFLTPFIGFIILGIGVWIFATKFKQWVREH